MDIESQLEMIYTTAQSETKAGSTCRDILLSLWDDGTSHGCDLREVLSLDEDHYLALKLVMDRLYQKNQQLDHYMTTRQITVLDSIDYGADKRARNDATLGVADTYSKVKIRR
jgi:hypothetical protein